MSLFVDELISLIDKLNLIDTIYKIQKLNSNEAKKYKLLCEYIFELLKEHKFKVEKKLDTISSLDDHSVKICSEPISVEILLELIEKLFVCHCRLRCNFKEPNYNYKENMYKHSIEFLLSSELLTDESLSNPNNVYLKLFEYLYINEHNLCNKYTEEYNDENLIEHCINYDYTILFNTIIKHLEFNIFPYKIDDNTSNMNVIGFLINKMKYSFIKMIPIKFYENNLENLINCYNYLNRVVGCDARFSCENETKLNDHQQMSKYFFDMIIKHPDFKKYFAKETGVSFDDNLKKKLDEKHRELDKTKSDLIHISSLFQGGGTGSYNRVVIKKSNELKVKEDELKVKEDELKVKEDKLKVKEDELKTLKFELENSNSKDELTRNRIIIKDLTDKLNQQNDRVNYLKNIVVKSKEDELKVKEDELKSLKFELENSNSKDELKSKNDMIKHLEEKLQERGAVLIDLEHQLKSKEKSKYHELNSKNITINYLNNLNDAANKERKLLMDTIEYHTKQSNEKDKQINELEETNDILRKTIQAHENQKSINGLLAEIQNLLEKEKNPKENNTKEKNTKENNTKEKNTKEKNTKEKNQ